MHFGNIRVNSVKIWIFKKFRMPSGKRRVPFVSGRHVYDDRWRNAPDVFRKASIFFKFPIFAEIYRIVTEIAEMH